MLDLLGWREMLDLLEWRENAGENLLGRRDNARSVRMERKC